MASEQFCPDGHRCDNGSMCTENPYDEGGYYCDCDQVMAETDAAVAGRYCEHKATSYCTYNQEVSMISFCTNDGTCKVLVSPTDAHLGCDCPSGYEGDHCQFVEGSAPTGWPFDGSSNPNYNSGKFGGSDAGMKGGVVAIIVLVVLAFVGTLAFFVYQKRRAHATPHTKGVMDASDLHLDADGSVLKESMNSNHMHDMSNGSIAPDQLPPTTADFSDVVQDDSTEDMQDIQINTSSEGGPSEII